MKLYFAYVGANSQDRLIEDHEIIFIVAKTPQEAKERAKEKTKLTSGVHVDVLAEVKNVDGYNITFEKSNSPEQIQKVLDYYS